ncbi:MAG: RNA polymerase sigma factor SigJ [Sandaracinus sp.]
MTDDLATFQTHRPALLSLAYRMLGELARAEDVVQSAWMRWSERGVKVQTPRSFLLTTVARLCLDELGTARHRREEPRGAWLPEPVDLRETELSRLETLDQISMAFLVLLQRLTPAERAVFLLHDVFDMGHAEIGERLGKSEVACRQLLKRARENVAEERRTQETSDEEHRRLFEAFVRAMQTGDESALELLLAEDASLVVDAGPASRYGRIRALGGPVVGAARVLGLVRTFLDQTETEGTRYEERLLNGRPAMVTIREGRVTAAVTFAVASGRIRGVYVQYDPAKLVHVPSSA